MVTPRRSVAIGIGLLVLWGLAGPPGVVKAQPGPPGATPPVPSVDLHGDPLPTDAVLRLGTVKYRQDSPISRIAYTPDGKHFLTDGEDSVLRVWDAAAGRVIRRIDPGVGALEDFAPTSDGQLVMALGTSFEVGKGFVQNVTLADFATGQLKEQASWPVEDPGGHTLAICPDRRLVGMGVDRRGVWVLEGRQGAEVCRFAFGNGPVERIQFSRDGRWLAVEVPSEDRRRREVELRLHDLARKRELRVIRQSGFRFADFAFSPDGGRIAIAMNAGLDVWDVASGERTPLGNDEVDHLCYSADGTTLVGVARSGSVSLFDLGVRKRIGRFDTHSTHERAAALSPDRGTLLEIAKGGLRAWDLEAGRERFAAADAPAEPATVLLFPPDGKTVITGGLDRALRFWELGSGRPSRSLRLSGPVDLAALSPAGRWLVAGPIFDSQVYVWDLSGRGGSFALAYPGGGAVPGALALRFTGEHTVVLVDRAGRLHGVELEARRVTPGAELQLSRSDPAAARFRELMMARDPNPELARLFEVEPPQIAGQRLFGAAFLTDGRTLAGLGGFTGLHLVEVGTGKEVAHDVGGEVVIPSPDGRILAIATSRGKREMKREDRMFNRRWNGIEIEPSGGEIRLVDAGTGREKVRIDVERGRVWAMAFSPNGRTLAASSGWETGRIHFYDVRHGEEIRRIDGPPMRSAALAFTPDGSRLVSGMADGSILVWDVRADPRGR